MNHDKFHMKSFNHSVFPSFSSLKFILQSGVFATQQQNVLPEQRSGFPMQHCHGTCLEGGPVERLGVGHQQLGTLDQCISDVPCMDYTHTNRSKTWPQLVGKCINMAYMLLEYSYDFPKSTCFSIYIWGVFPLPGC